MTSESLSGKKVLLVGLGKLGGGVATAKWLIKRGVRLTVTDLKNEYELAPSLKKLESFKEKITFVLGKHRERDFADNEIIVVNPDVSLKNRYLEIARGNGRKIENEFSLFLKEIDQKQLIAVTGTRGKTTTATWIHHILKTAYQNTMLAGNFPERPLLESVEKYNRKEPVVVETPSFLLEHLESDLLSPRMAIITNIYPDHLNRHETMENYASIKAKIFKNQNKENVLIINGENNPWTSFLLNKNPQSKVYFFSTNEELDKNLEGAFLKNKKVIFRLKGTEEAVLEVSSFNKKWGLHNVQNLLTAILAAHLFGSPFRKIRTTIDNLPLIRFREELIYDNGHIKIYNDSASTSPEATIAAVKRFSGGNLILICGGTDRSLDFSALAREINSHLSPENVFLLAGSGTDKLLKDLQFSTKYPIIKGELGQCLLEAIALARSRTGPSTIIFSPGAKSFEQFRNEYHRGESFNHAVESLLK
ncbi:MAG: UDP-N-acetylmuramoyl-L-alanine--D-glutamate ligase [Candidatus Taylorbacteria bacterium]|nr:UDP-N-acetylmuramoyl-L-alanine--D-glutamate ligase [Candidatus Taylorbacteria bacterium]